MNKKIAFVFPGQGSQQVGMGQSLYQQSRAAKEVFDHADDILHVSLSQVMFQGPMEQLTQTSVSQLAVFVMSMAVKAMLQHELPYLKPDMVAGLSLGEYSALTCANVFNFETALQVVKKRAELMEQACRAHPGTMAAVLGLDIETIQRICATSALSQELWIANYNTPTQTVISGTVAAIEEVIKEIKACGGKAIILKVAGAFHSGLMQSACQGLEQLLEQVTFNPSHIPIYMNVTGDIETDLNQMKKNLVKQVASSVLWAPSIAKMDVDLFVEVGWGTTLKGLVSKTTQIPIVSVSDIRDIEQMSV